MGHQIKRIERSEREELIRELHFQLSRSNPFQAARLYEKTHEVLNDFEEATAWSPVVPLVREAVGELVECY